MLRINLLLRTTMLATRPPARTVSRTIRLLTLLQSTLLTLLMQSLILKKIERDEKYELSKMEGLWVNNTHFSFPSATLPLAIEETYIPLSLGYWGSSLPPTKSNPRSSSDARPLWGRNSSWIACRRVHKIQNIEKNWLTYKINIKYLCFPFL